MTPCVRRNLGRGRGGSQCAQCLPLVFDSQEFRMTARKQTPPADLSARGRRFGRTTLPDFELSDVELDAA